VVKAVDPPNGQSVRALQLARLMAAFYSKAARLNFMQFFLK
jgi:hypothetical protein